MPEFPISYLISRSWSAEQLATEILSWAGPYIRIADIWKLLGYCCPDAARKAAAGQRLGIEAVSLPGRSGRFVRSRELALWVYEAAIAEPLSGNPGSSCSQIKKEDDARTA